MSSPNATLFQELVQLQANLAASRRENEALHAQMQELETRLHEAEQEATTSDGQRSDSYYVAALMEGMLIDIDCETDIARDKRRVAEAAARLARVRAQRMRRISIDGFMKSRRDRSDRIIGFQKTAFIAEISRAEDEVIKLWRIAGLWDDKASGF